MNSSITRSSRWLAPSMLAALLVLTGSAQAPANTQLPAGSVVPSERHRSVARRVGSMLEGMHYSGSKLDDRLSAIVYTRYLESIDGQHTSLLASDVADFEQYKLRFDDMIRSGDVDPAFAIFARFQQRNRERIKFAIAQLDKEPDWTLNEAFEFDREKAPWASAPAELDDWWRKRVKNDALSLLLTGKSWDEASKLLKKRYETTLKRVDQVSADDVFESLMNSYARAYDPHSSYFSPRSSEEYRIQMSLNYDGIGASLQLVDDYVTIMNVIEGGPAAVAGTLSIKDRITGVGQGKEGPVTDVLGWRIDDVVQLIRGRAGTQVRLQVLPAGAAPGTPEKTLEFTRNKVTLEAQAAQKELRTIKRGDKEIRVGVINVPAFYQDVEAQNAGDKEFRSTTRDVRRLINELKTEKIDGLVLDLRGNGGGYLPEATALTGLFIDKGPVVQLKVTTGELEVQDDPEAGRRVFGPARGARRPLQRLGLGNLRRRHPGLSPRRRSSASAPSARAPCRTSCRSIAGHRARSTASSPSPSASSIASPAKAPSIAASSPTSRCLRRSTWMNSARARSKAPCPGIASRECRSAAKARRCSRTSPCSPPKRKRVPTAIPTIAGSSRTSPPPRRCANRPRCRSTCRPARRSANASSSERLTPRERAPRRAEPAAAQDAEELADAKFPDTVLDQATEVMTDMVTGLRPVHPRPIPHGSRGAQARGLIPAKPLS